MVLFIVLMLVFFIVLFMELLDNFFKFFKLKKKYLVFKKSINMMLVIIRYVVWKYKKWNICDFWEFESWDCYVLILGRW